jgi:UDP-N-acetylmuramate dehydrogenase
MSAVEEAFQRLRNIPHLQVNRNEPLWRHARFGFGGPALLFADTDRPEAFVEALRLAPACGMPWAVVGGGTNLIVSDAGYRGLVLRYRGAAIRVSGDVLRVQSGALLQDVVDHAIAAGLRGLETMTGIPGYVGAAVYGNAGAYGRSMSDMVTRVEYFDGAEVRTAGFEECAFRYRTSRFKQEKGWLILSCDLQLSPGDRAELEKTAAGIREIRDRKYPPAMACAGSIFKNRIVAELPANAQAELPGAIVKGGKAPSAWFLEQVGAKGLSNGGIRVTEGHANTLYNAGGGTAAQFVELVGELKRRVRERFGFELEEEVQYMGFAEDLPGLAQLRATPFAIQGMLAGLQPDALAWKATEDRWSIREVLAHLEDIDRALMLPRVRSIVEQERPEVASYNVEEVSLPQDGFGLAALEAFLAARRESVSYLETLPVEALRRTAVHSRAGEITLADVLHHWAFHDLGHIRQIAEIVRAVGYLPRMGRLQAGYTVKP